MEDIPGALKAKQKHLNLSPLIIYTHVKIPVFRAEHRSTFLYLFI